MTHAVIIGAGLGGLAAALFLARRGHEVDLFERDADAPPDDAKAAFSTWTRRGVPQARHAHAFLGLSGKVLKEEAPDVIAALRAAGATRVRMPGGDLPGVELITARRLTYEALLRHFVGAEKNVRLHAGVTIEELVAAPGQNVPRIVGVRTNDGQECRADLVADASGRWTRGDAWLAAAGARQWKEQAVESPFVYLTRHFRLKPGAQTPGDAMADGSDLTYGSATAFQGDNDVFGMVFLTSTEEPLRGSIVKNEKFDAVMQAIPRTAAWFELGEPINDVQVLGRIDNRRRSLVDDKGPVVSGYVLLGDAAMHTNPVFGRGVSLAFAHAQHLAQTIDQAIVDPEAYAVAFQDWTRKTITVWYSGSVQADMNKSAQMARAFRGEAAPTPPTMAFGPALTELAKEDPALGMRWARLNHLLDPPFAMFSDPSVMERLQAYIAAHPDILPKEPLSRRDFEAIVKS
jgi:2-polyprenyl-6-methoxyphenol hydroxylase-like FAD-dependent oxidoreductase